MTTVAYSKGVMAADTQVSYGPDNACEIRKIRKVSGYLLGFCGDLDLGVWFVRNFSPSIITDRARITPPSPIVGKDDFEALIVAPNGKVYIYTDKCMLVNIQTFGYYSIGSGSPFAMGAMYSGADARTAIKSAIKFDSGTGGRVQYIKLGK